MLQVEFDQIVTINVHEDSGCDKGGIKSHDDWENYCEEIYVENADNVE